MLHEYNALFWLVATVVCYALSRVVNRRFQAWWSSPLLLACVLCLLLTIALDVKYEEYMRGGRWLLLLLGPATVSFALPIYQKRQLIRAYWPTLLIGLAFGCALALGEVWLVSGWLGLPQFLRVSLLPRSFSTPFAMAFARSVGSSPEMAAVGAIATGVLGASLGPVLLRILPLRTAFARGAMLGMGALGAGVARAHEIGTEEAAVAGLVVVLAGVTCALMGATYALLH